jgi:hypothetical protein
VDDILVTPMTLLRHDDLREIFDGLAAHDLDVSHFLVHADAQELVRRINHDQAVPSRRGAGGWSISTPTPGPSPGWLPAPT